MLFLFKVEGAISGCELYHLVRSDDTTKAIFDMNDNLAEQDLDYDGFELIACKYN